MVIPNIIEEGTIVNEHNEAVNQGIQVVADAASKAFNPEGKKFDQGKLRWDLLPWAEIEDVVNIMTYGAAKYEANNWQKVAPHRYIAAAMRHFVAWLRGEKNDSESGMHHLAHCACNIIFLLHKDKNNV